MNTCPVAIAWVLSLKVNSGGTACPVRFNRNPLRKIDNSGWGQSVGIPCLAPKLGYSLNKCNAILKRKGTQTNGQCSPSRPRKLWKAHRLWMEPSHLPSFFNDTSWTKIRQCGSPATKRSRNPSKASPQQNERLCESSYRVSFPKDLGENGRHYIMQSHHFKQTTRWGGIQDVCLLLCK